jgi:hypothetical protein
MDGEISIQGFCKGQMDFNIKLRKTSDEGNITPQLLTMDNIN